MAPEDKRNARTNVSGKGIEVPKLLDNALAQNPEEGEVKELKLFKGIDNASVEQDPNNKVLDWIDRADGKEHFLSFYLKGAPGSGRLIS